MISVHRDLPVYHRLQRKLEPSFEKDHTPLNFAAPWNNISEGIAEKSCKSKSRAAVCIILAKLSVLGENLL